MEVSKNLRLWSFVLRMRSLNPVRWGCTKWDYRSQLERQLIWLLKANGVSITRPGTTLILYPRRSYRLISMRTRMRWSLKIIRHMQARSWTSTGSSNLEATCSQMSKTTWVVWAWYRTPRLTRFHPHTQDALSKWLLTKRIRTAKKLLTRPQNKIRNRD